MSTDSNSNEMRPCHRWQDWVNFLLGIWLIACLWIFHDTAVLKNSASSSGWDACVMGCIVIVMALWALAAPSVAVPEWINVIAGVWLFIAPFMLHYGHLITPFDVSQWIVSVIVFALALSVARFLGGTHHPGHHSMA